MNEELLEIKRRTPDFLPRARRVGWVCPKCGNGLNESGDGLVLDANDPTRTHYKCFKVGCDFYGDILDLIGLAFGLDEFKDQLEKAREFYGIEKSSYKNSQKQTTTPPVKAEPQTPETDYSKFIKDAAKNNDYKYLLARGISEETQKRFRVGFVENWRSFKAVATVLSKGGNPDNLPTSPRCIIPRNNYNYLARDIRDNLEPEQEKYKKMGDGKKTIFNADALKESVVFVVEGEIDAMSLEEVGASACGLCGSTGIRSLTDYLKNNYKGKQCFIIMLDNDDNEHYTGQKAAENLSNELEKLNIPFICVNLKDYETKGHHIKDANDFLLYSREELQELVISLKADAETKIKEHKGSQYNALDLLTYFENIENQPQAVEISTGFTELDKNLQGGLSDGLYCIGAISSLGKTTFTLQIADQIAQTGEDVLFFSLEMSKYELIAKSISRKTYELARNRKTREGYFLARDTVQILNNKRYKYYTEEERQIIKNAISSYSDQAKNLYIYEGRYNGERLKVAHIRNIVNDHIKRTGKKPTVFIDYLQILAPEDPRQTDKQATDNAVYELKEISREYSIPVFAISSFNRDNYNEPVSMSSFKESGAVEYSSDVLFGLQYSGMDYQRGEKEKERNERIRRLRDENERKARNKEPIDIELKCLKQRKGYKFTLCYQMMSAFNHFEPISGVDGFRKTDEPTPFDKSNNKKIL